MKAKEEDLKRLIALKELQEKKFVLNLQEGQEMMKLRSKYVNFLNMDSKELKRELSDLTTVKQQVVSDNIKSIISDYKKLYQNESWYKEPEAKDNQVTLAFPSEKETINFFQQEAKQNKAFKIYDESKQNLLAYSTGDGVLYNGNGTVLTGDKFHGAQEQKSDPEMPKPDFRL